jgi:hypothetical protein
MSYCSHQKQAPLSSTNTVSDTNWVVRAIADMDNDGDPDLIWQHQTEGWLVGWLMDDIELSEGRFLSPNRVTDTNWDIVGAADFDNDGDNDLLWQHDQSGLMAIWRMAGTSFVGPGVISNNSVSDTNWKIKATVDMDGNEFPDFLWHHQTTGALVVWYLNGTTLMLAQASTPSQVDPVVWQLVAPYVR